MGTWLYVVLLKRAYNYSMKWLLTDQVRSALTGKLSPLYTHPNILKVESFLQVEAPVIHIIS